MWAEEGIERMAGKGWKEMQHEREQKENYDMKQRVQRGLRQVNSTTVFLILELCSKYCYIYCIEG